MIGVTLPRPGRASTASPPERVLPVAGPSPRNPKANHRIETMRLEKSHLASQGMVGSAAPRAISQTTRVDRINRILQDLIFVEKT